jgi:hypothetical protein
MARLWKVARYVPFGLALALLIGPAPRFISAEQANAKTLQGLDPGISGWILRSETLVEGLTQVFDATGKRVSGTYPPEDAYVLWYTTPPQRGCL